VTIDRCKGGGSNEAKTLVEWNVCVRIGIPKFFREPEIDEVYNIGVLSETHNDVARFEIAVNEVARMYVLQTMELGTIDISSSVVVLEVEFTHQLSSQKQYSLDRERKTAFDEEVLQRKAKAIDRHCIKTSFPTKPMDTRDTSPSLEPSVDIEFIAQAVNISFNTLEFKDDVVSRQNVACKVYFVCVSRPMSKMRGGDPIALYIRDSPDASSSCNLYLPANRTSSISRIVWM
jgi:hypothetical protein